MRILFLILITTINLSASRYVLEIDSCLHNKALEIAQGEIGVTEATGKNDGEVEKYLKIIGLGKGYPYCAAGISWSYYQAAKYYNKTKSFIPFPMTAGSQVVYDHARKVGEKGSNNVEPQDFFIWRKKDSYQGHIGIIESIGEKGWVQTIEFNTSGDNRGDQRDGGGVWRKKRNLIHPLGRFLVRGFVGFKKQPSNLCGHRYIEISKADIIETRPNYIKNDRYLSILDKLFLNIKSLI